MGTGDYICVTLRGGAPWGFNLQEGEGETYRPFLISQVDESGRAFLAGVRDGDEVVSINGEPCADLTLLRAFALIDTSIECLQLLLKRYHIIFPEECESEETYCGEMASSGKALESTTLHIFSPKHRSQTPRELCVSEGQDETCYRELDSDNKFPKRLQPLSTQLHVPSSDDRGGCELYFKEKSDGEQQWVSLRDMVELQVSLSEQTLDDVGCTSLGSARGIEGEFSNREGAETFYTATTLHCIPCPARQPLSQHGVVVSSPSMLGQVEVTLQQPAASGAGRGIHVGGPGVSESIGSRSEGEEGGGHFEDVSGSFTVSFEIPSEEGAPVEEQGSDSEGDQDKPNKHRAKHARLRRNESLSEKQVKEAKSKCKRIALLLTAAPPNPNNKGVLMFKKHRQRAKKYTLVSYGTGDDEPEYSDEEDESNSGNKQETSAGEFTFLASESDKPFLINVPSYKGALTFSLDKGLLEIERNLNSQSEMECLPDTKGKGALMFAQRRQRMDEISAEHEEMRRQGMPVEGLQETEKKLVEHSYMQSTTEGHAYMDSMAATPYSHAASGTNQDSVSQGEQIASRDERISTPAIRTGLLTDTKKRNTGKPMFTFKETPKLSPNPALLNLLNSSGKKLGFESGPEEDYLSLGAEACNFLQSQRVKPKIPPPVAPKPVINPNSPPWSPQIESTNQDIPQCAENSLSTPAAAPAAETLPVPQLEPIAAPASEPRPPPAPKETPVNTNTAEQHTWTLQEPESQQPLETTAIESDVQVNSSHQPESSHVTSWGAAQTQAQQQAPPSSWHPAQIQPQESLPSQSPPQPPWSKYKTREIHSHPGPNLKNKHKLSHWFSQPGHMQTNNRTNNKFSLCGVKPNNQSTNNPRASGHSNYKMILNSNHLGYNNPRKSPKYNLHGLKRFSQSPSHNRHGFSLHSTKLCNSHGHKPKHRVNLSHLGSQVILNINSNHLMHGAHHKLKPKLNHPGSMQHNHIHNHSLKLI
ncbi:unnamed protein product [Menidia menidia]|uniref:(Atlantic silverside) hypothetical protein n=1 Tax=Menidia menidia TaxID=238744 RepID=A0A8S4B4Z1_9TELE|nr:unnamed protein product [Menidia menidia]